MFYKPKNRSSNGERNVSGPTTRRRHEEHQLATQSCARGDLHQSQPRATSPSNGKRLKLVIEIETTNKNL